MPTSLQNYIQEQKEELNKIISPMYSQAEAGCVEDMDVKLNTLYSETFTHLIEMMREMVEGKKYNPDNTRFVQEFNQALDDILSQFPNPKQS